MIRPAPRAIAWALAALAVAGPRGARAGDAPEGVAFFEAKIRPVLVRECYGCHSAGSKSLKGGLRLDTREGLRAGGDSGPAVTPGQPDESPMLDALRHDGLAMPPRGRLPDAVVADFTRWVEMGAPDPRTALTGVPTVSKTGIDVDAGRRFWAYVPPRRHPAPAVRDPAWPCDDIDRFILAGLEARGLKPAGDADRLTLIRRLSYDLVGLPPSPEEADAFAADPAPDAYERLVDRLLASPRFGERWGRHWLDVVRFAESLTLRGLVFKEAWRYRDYVIEAFNADRPFDRFVSEQIAGDLLPGDGLADLRRQRVATTFLVLGNTNLEEQDKAQLRMDVVDEQLDTTGKALLGQTLGCARCHDHKFDPIPTKDYYALAGILRNTRSLEHANVSRWLEFPLPDTPARVAEAASHEGRVAELAGRVNRLKAEANKAPKGKPGNATRAVLASLEAELKRLKAGGPGRDMVMSVSEEPRIEDARVHVRGSVHSLGEIVPRGVLRVATVGPPPVMPSHESGRLELAAWVASKDNPLTARVFVNRVWLWLIGEGIVRTPDNFGTTGEPPTHPELLDDLAVRFVEDGWSVKRLVRRVVLSRTYRLGSSGGSQTQGIDPENRLVSRANRRRLDAECLRDTMLLAAGRLRFEMGGPSVPGDLGADYGYATDDGRRSVYLPVFRNALPEIFQAFDFPDPSLVVGRRNQSVVAPQALFLMNSPFVLRMAHAAGKRLLLEAPGDAEARVERAYRLILGRRPTGAEGRVALAAVSDEPDRPETWAALAQALFASFDFRSLR